MSSHDSDLANERPAFDVVARLHGACWLLDCQTPGDGITHAATSLTDIRSIEREVTGLIGRKLGLDVGTFDVNLLVDEQLAA